MNLDEEYKVKMDELKENIRTDLLEKYPELLISFEPIELTEKIMAQGASTPIEVRVAGKKMEDIKSYATALMEKLRKIVFLRGRPDRATPAYANDPDTYRQKFVWR